MYATRQNNIENISLLSINKVETPFELIHCDLWGKYHTATNNGSQYFLTIIDNYTCGTWVYLMKHKTKILQHLISFSNLIKRQFNMHIKRIRSDNMIDFTNSDFKRIKSDKPHSLDPQVRVNIMQWHMPQVKYYGYVIC